MVLKLPQGHEDSEYVPIFEIGQRKGGFYSERTESQTDRVTEPFSTVLVYRLVNIKYDHHSKHQISAVFFTNPCLIN